MSQLVKTIPAELTELRAASTASGGTALTTSASLITIPFGADYMSITPRNFADGAAVARVSLNPFLHIVYTTDLLVGSAGDYLSDEMQDGDTTDNSFAAWDTLANSTALYVGAHLPFRGVKVDIGTTPNAVASSVLTIKYWNGGWVDTVNSEGTDSGGVCLAVDGDESWTLPTAWEKTSLISTGATARSDGPFGTPMYWTRWETDKAMTASMDIISILALNRSTAYAEYLEGQAVETMLSDRKIGCVEALTNAGTANLLVNVGTVPGREFE